MSVARLFGNAETGCCHGATACLWLKKICLSAAFLFFMTGLLTGIWKYRHMARSEDATSPVYVDIAHRSSLLYSFAALLLAAFSAHSVLADWVNTIAAVAAPPFSERFFRAM
ncbi:hypothetical protein [Marinobacter algicola]|uniref:hypothetical protein n=1 Tax=Marinobacter algicola TaxID=236100 RepID=UPI003BAC84C0